MDIRKEYRRLRGIGWTATEAFRAAKVRTAWEYAESAGIVSLEVVPDDSWLTFDDLMGDTFNRAANPDIPESRMAREEKAERERFERDGVVGIVAKAHGEHVDSVWGFIGDDWKDSGYDVDLMAAALAVVEPTPSNWCAL